MYTFFLALRYLWTRPLSWVSVIGIWLSVTATITTVAIMTGFLGELTGTIRGITSDIVINPTTNFTRSGHALPPADYATISRAISAVKQVESTAPHLLRPALLRVGRPGERSRLDERSFVKLIGVDPERERVTTRFFKYVERPLQDDDRYEGDAAGRPSLEADPGGLTAADVFGVDDPRRPFWIDRDKLPPEQRSNADLPVLLFGTGLMRHYDLKKGDVVRLATMPSNAVADEREAIKPQTSRWVVGGAVRTGHFGYDGQFVYADLSAARSFADSPSDSSEICVRATDGADLAALSTRLRNALDQRDIKTHVLTWEQHFAGDLGPIRNQRSILAVLLFFFVIVACFNIFATLTILVSDKTRDIGLLSAMGATRGGVASVFTACGLVISTLGTALGVASGYLVSHNINGLNDLIGEITGVRIFRASIYNYDRVPIDIQGWFVAAVVAITIVFAVVCAFLPAMRAARMDPVRALRYE